MGLSKESVVVVAGAGGGAGSAMVRRLTAAGATVIAADNSPERAEQAASVVAADVPGRAVPASVDLLDFEATKRWAAELAAEYGRIDGLVHLVGGWRGSKTFLDTDLADWDLLHKLLIQTTQHTSLAFADALARSGDGRFALISATAASAPTEGNAAYGAAKAAAEAWTLALANSFKKQDCGAAATVFVIKALLTDAMRAEKPDAAFTGYTHADDLAEAVAGLWDAQAADVNGTRIRLTP